MHADLEAILAADEESRARVALATSVAERRANDARAAAEAERQQRLAAAEAKVAAEIDEIRRSGDERVAELQRAHDSQLRTLAGIGEAHFEDAVRAFIEIVCTPEANK